MVLFLQFVLNDQEYQLFGHVLVEKSLNKKGEITDLVARKFCQVILNATSKSGTEHLKWKYGYLPSKTWCSGPKTNPNFTIWFNGSGPSSTVTSL